MLPLLHQRWTLFAPELNDHELSIYVRVPEGSASSGDIDLAATIQTRSRSRFLYPSRIDRLVDFCSRQLANAATLVHNSRRLDPGNPRSTGLQNAAITVLLRSEAACLPIITALTRRVTGQSPDSAQVVMRVADGEVAARLLCSADARWTTIRTQSSRTSQPRSEPVCTLPSFGGEIEDRLAGAGGHQPQVSAPRDGTAGNSRQ